MSSSESEIDEKITIIMGQTNYTFEEAGNLLKLQNNDEIAIIRDYLRSSSKHNIVSKTDCKSKNQLIYKEIRNFMDGCINSNNNNLSLGADK